MIVEAEDERDGEESERTQILEKKNETDNLLTEINPDAHVEERASRESLKRAPQERASRESLKREPQERASRERVSRVSREYRESLKREYRERERACVCFFFFFLKGIFSRVCIMVKGWPNSPSTKKCLFFEINNFVKGTKGG